MLATFMVTNSLDAPENTPAAVGTLRQAIFDANQLDDQDTIEFASSLNGATIHPNAALGIFSSYYNIQQAVTIDASMLSRGITIEGDNGTDHMPGTLDGSRIFRIAVGSIGSPEVKLINLTLTGGDINGSGGAISFTGGWNGVDSEAAKLTVLDSRITGNAGSGGGGIAAAYGVLNIVGSQLEDNVAAYGSGGGVRLSDVPGVTVSGSKFIDNTSSRNGGGLSIESESSSNFSIVVKVQESEFVGNKAISTSSSPFLGNGGGIYANIRGFDDSTETTRPKLEIIDSTISGDNEASNDGGGIWTCTKYGAEFTMTRSTVSGNTAGTLQESPYPGFPPTIIGGHGGGVWIAVVDYQQNNLYDLGLVNSTLSDNEALAQGGGVWLGFAQSPYLNQTGGILNAKLDFLTIAKNQSPDGGGLYSEPDNPLHRITTTLNNTIVSSNVVSKTDSTANNIGGRIELDSSYNLIGPGVVTAATLTSGSGNISNASNDPGLAPLALNGGPTKTHAPLDGSPAIDAGDPAAVAGMNGVPEFDQRGTGFTRVFDGNGTGGAQVDIGAHEVGLAKVVNVTISGSLSDHDPFSFNDPNDDDKDFDGSGKQLRTVPVGGADTVMIKFSEVMANVASNSLKLTGLRSAVVPTLASTNGFTPDPDNQEYRWKFDAPFEADQYLIALTDAVMDDFGRALDGEWTNPFSVNTSSSAGVSTFPSGDDTAGGDFNFVFTILPGDANLDNDVGGSDFLIWQRSTVGTGHTFVQADYDGDGDTDSADNAFWSANYGLYFGTLFVAADFDGDGNVDGDDLVIWQGNFDNEMDHTHGEGDADMDGDVDGNDFLFWQRQNGLEIDWV